MIRKYNKSYDNTFAHTYSIVARDPKTGEMGVGVQSHWFSVFYFLMMKEGMLGKLLF